LSPCRDFSNPQIKAPWSEYKTNKAHVSDRVAAIALVEILVGYAQVAVVGKRPPKSTFARNHIHAPGMHSPNTCLSQILIRGNQAASVAATELLIETLQKQGYRFVSVGEMLELMAHSDNAGAH
jgi:hypothetical protein